MQLPGVLPAHRGPDRDTVASVTDPTSVPAFEDARQARPLRDRVVESLAEAGYEPVLDDDGDVAVVVQGQQVFVRAMDTVPQLLRVFGQWLIGEEVPGDLLIRLSAANAVTAALNLVKATVHEDRLVVAVDLVVSEGLVLPSLLTATLDATVAAVQTWHATVLEVAQGGGGGPGTGDPGGGGPGAGTSRSESSAPAGI